MNPIVRFALPLAALVLALPALAEPRTETRNVSGFTSLGLSAPVHVDLVIGAQDSLVLEGDAEALARIDTYVENGTLHIKRKQEHQEWKMGWRNEIRARVTAKRIGAIAISGSGDVNAPQLSSESLALHIAGSGDIAIGGGKVDNLAVQIAGSGDVKVPKLDAQAVSVHISGSGNALVWARQSLAVQVAGSGDVRYYGDPTVARSVVGSGSVKRLGAAPA